MSAGSALTLEIEMEFHDLWGKSKLGLLPAPGGFLPWAWSCTHGTLRRLTATQDLLPNNLLLQKFCELGRLYWQLPWNDSGGDISVTWQQLPLHRGLTNLKRAPATGFSAQPGSLLSFPLLFPYSAFSLLSLVGSKSTVLPFCQADQLPPTLKPCSRHS